MAFKLIASFWELGDDMSNYVKDEVVREVLSEVESLNQLDNINILKIDDFEAPSPHKLQHIKQTLIDIPPVEPDLKRQIEFINRTLQFIEIKFEGAKINGTKLKLPKGTLPFKSAELIENIESRLRIFDDVEQYESFKNLSIIESSLNELRKNYLYRSKSKEMNILKMNQKTIIVKKVEEQKEELDKTLSNLATDLKNGIDSSKKTLKNELVNFYKINIPAGFSKNYKFEGNEALLNAYCDEIVNKINYPEVFKMIQNIKITHNEYDLAIEDYDNEVFLEELAGSDFLSQEEYAELFQSETAIKVKAVINEKK